MSATLYPGTWFDNGQWIIDVDSPAPIPVASLVYDDYGYLSSLTLNSGLSMQFGTPTPSGLVPQSLHGSDGTLLTSVLAAGGTNAMGIAPTQLDAVATQLGLGARFLRYDDGSGPKDCPKSDTKASTTVNGQRVAICRSFRNSTDGWNAVYLIHEMMHTLGQGEAPMPGQPSSAQLNQDVNTACGH